MIQKIIHYCWFGGKPLPELAQKCIESWKKYCPEYEIKRWDETNFDLNYNDYVREAYEAKKWAFVTDVVRLFALVTYGGIYMDTDVEVIKPLDKLLNCEAVFGFESDKWISTGFMACKKEQKIFTELLNDYGGTHFETSDGFFDMTTNVERVTNFFMKRGLIANNSMQTIDEIVFLPKEYLCPKDPTTQKINITEHTLTIHHFDGSWMNDEEKLSLELRVRYQKFMPESVAIYIATFIAAAKMNGIKETINRLLPWIKKKVITILSKDNSNTM